MSDCMNCHEEITECKCDSPRTFSDREGPECPYCGEVSRACDSDGLLYDESREEWECDHCGKEFFVSIFIHHTWSCERKEK